MPSPALSFFLTSRRDVVYLDLLEISHPNFTQVYRRVRNHAAGVAVTLETGETAAFEYYPMHVTELGEQVDLDTGLRIDFGDLGEILPQEVDAVTDAAGLGIKPTIIYRAYRSDDLTAPLVGPLRLEATSFSFQREGASFEAHAPYVNRNKTGETYNLTRFFMLRGYV